MKTLCRGITPLVLALTVTLQLVAARSVLSQEITDISRSLENSPFLALPNKPEQEWFEGRPNFGRLFERPDFTDVLTKWSFRPLKGLILVNRKSYKSRQLMVLEDEYQNERRERSRLQIYIPHPRTKELLELNLVEEIAVLQPPRLQVTKSEPYPLDKIEGTFYTHTDGNCSVLFTLEGPAFVNILSKPCSEKETLDYIARALFLERLQSKLTS